MLHSGTKRSHNHRLYLTAEVSHIRYAQDFRSLDNRGNLGIERKEIFRDNAGTEILSADCHSLLTERGLVITAATMSRGPSRQAQKLGAPQTVCAS